MDNKQYSLCSGKIPKLDKLKSKLHLIGVEFDYSTVTINDELYLSGIKSVGLNELDLSKHEIDRLVATLTFIDSGIKKIIVDTNYTELAEYAFSSSEDIEEIQFTNSDIRIPSGLCRECNSLESIITNIPGAIIEIGSYSFYKCRNFKNIDISTTYSIGSEAFTETNIQLGGEYRLLKYIESGAFKLTRGLGKIELPNIEYISNRAFYKSSIQSILIGRKCVSVGEDAFYNCEKLESITILSDSIKCIGRDRKLLTGCTNLRRFIVVEGSELADKIINIKGDETVFREPSTCRFYIINKDGEITRQVR